MGPEQEYLAFLAEGRFMLQRGKISGTYIFHPRVAVPGSGEPELEWVEASGEGVVYASTVVRNRPPAEDYNVALVDLAEGVRMMARVIGVAPGEVRIGMALTAHIGDIDGIPAVLFTPRRP